VAAAVGYAATGSLGTILLGRRLVPLNNLQLQKEADFRFALGRIRERHHSDGQGGEKTRLLARFQAVVANFRDIINVTRNVGFFTKEYNYLIQIIPALVVAPLYFRGQVEFGVIPQAVMAFSQVLGAFSLIVTKFQELTTFAAVVNRLGSMWEATESRGGPTAPRAEETREEAAGINRVTDNERIAYEKLTLWTPGDKRILLRDLTLEVPEGKRLLVTGPDGSGKTALCLASAGLWGAGNGRIVAPSTDQIMFLPQRLYTATGRLGDLLRMGHDSEPGDDEPLRHALRAVGLDYLAEQAGGLDSQWDWPNDLSAGDQHALALARLLLARPRFAFLDGVPWALTLARLERVYDALAHSPTTYISLGSPASLLPYHDYCLELLGDGKWRLRSMDDAAMGEGKARHGEKAVS
jgi:putative ATP-binding cassette transporter